jgi:hypothetical protein
MWCKKSLKVCLTTYKGRSTTVVTRMLSFRERHLPYGRYETVARRGIQVVDRDGFVLNPLPGQAQPPPPPQAQPPPVVAPPVPAFGANVAPAA